MADEEVSKGHKLHLPSKPIGIITVLGLGLVAVGVFVATQYQPPNPVQPQAQGVITSSTDTPSETPPPEDFKWVGADNDPRRILFPSLAVGGFVQRVGVDQSQQVAVPDNIHMAGWFVNSVQPGQKGLSIIDGHVDGLHKDTYGIFYQLQDLKRGDIFQIELGNGKMVNFRVMKVSLVAVKDAPGVLFSQAPTVASQLNLITCGGTFNKSAHVYEQRVIVTAAATQKS